MGGITTHILDTSLGRPAAGVAVTLCSSGGSGEWESRASARTDADGRARLLEAGDVIAGDYRLTFQVGSYLAERADDAFYPVVDVHFRVRREDEHHHVPLLLSPFGYSTYRGS